MMLVNFDPINFNLILGVFVGFSVVLMLKDTVVKLMTFIKGLNLY